MFLLTIRLSNLCNLIDDQMVKVNGMRWYGHVLRRDDGYVLRKALQFEKEVRTTKEDMEDASGEGEQE